MNAVPVSARSLPSMRRPVAGCTLVVALAVGLVATAQDKPAATPKAASAPGTKAKKQPVPGYEWRTIEGFQVLINQKVLSEAEQAKGKYQVEPLEVLENELKAVNHVLMPKLVKVLQNVTIWVEWDELPYGVTMTEEEKQRGGRVVAVYRYGSPYAAARSFQQGKVSHPGKMNAVEIMSLKRLTEMHQPGRDKDQIILLHELCHVVHNVFLGGENRDVNAAYAQAMERGLYSKVYARMNAHEYFAEISCAYLDRCNNFPYTAEELKDYDPVGYKLCEQVWGKQEVIAKARAKAAAEREARERMKRSVFTVGGGAKSGTASAPPTAADPEKAAAQKLAFARDLAKDGKAAKAKDRLRELIQQYPDTKAAAEAKKELAGM